MAFINEKALHSPIFSIGKRYREQQGAPIVSDDVVVLAILKALYEHTKWLEKELLMVKMKHVDAEIIASAKEAKEFYKAGTLENG